MAHDFDKFPELTNGQMQMYYFQSPHKQIIGGAFRAKVIKVTDGDTIRVSTSFRDFDFPIRIANIQAPELSEEDQDSRNWLKNKIEGLEVEVVVDQNNRVGRYGRLIAQIFSLGFSIGEESIRAGKSIPFDQRKETFPDLNKMIAKANK